MVFRNIIFVPYWFCQLLWYAAHTDSIPEEKKLALLKKIVAHANAGGNVTIKAYGTEHIPRDGSFMFYPNHQGLYDVLAIIDTCPRLFSVVMKKELKDKDIIYLYITGETSPLGTWRNMIPDIHGEHFRVTDEQWSYLREKFSIRGVPTYFVIDKEGNITYKQTGFPGVDTMKEQLMKALEK